MDADANGVRDDVDQYINTAYAERASADLLTNGIRLVLQSTLRANTNWGISPLLLSPTYSGGHSFIGYLTAEPSRTHILNDMESSLVAMASVNPC